MACCLVESTHYLHHCWFITCTISLTFTWRQYHKRYLSRQSLDLLIFDFNQITQGPVRQFVWDMQQRSLVLCSRNCSHCHVLRILQFTTIACNATHLTLPSMRQITYSQPRGKADLSLETSHISPLLANYMISNTRIFFIKWPQNIERSVCFVIYFVYTSITFLNCLQVRIVIRCGRLLLIFTNWLLCFSWSFSRNKKGLHIKPFLYSQGNYIDDDFH